MSMFINFGYCAVCFNGSLSDGRYMVSAEIKQDCIHPWLSLALAYHSI